VEIRQHIFEINVLCAAITEMLPSILSQLGPESVDNLRWLASTLSKTGDDGKVPTSATAAPIAEDDEEVPGELCTAVWFQTAHSSLSQGASRSWKVGAFKIPGLESHGK